jgi:acetyltransferase
LGIENLNLFFNPESIAVVGASSREDSLGAKILANLLENYSGTIFPVNPFRSMVLGLVAYPSVEKIPSKVDLAIIATPAHTIPQIVEECGKSQILNIIIVSAGLSDNDEEGSKLNHVILEHKKKYGMRILGPNSFGVIRPKNNLYATFGQKKAFPGKIAFISQSASLCGSVLDWSWETQVGLSAVVSTGSTLDVNLGDLIDYFGTDHQTKSIMLYIESIKDIRNFMSAARGFARTKPIILIKAGRFKERDNFNLPHDSQLGDKDAIYDAAFRRVGAVRVQTESELFYCAKALSMQQNPADNKLMIITNAGGPGLLAVDHLKTKGGDLSKLEEATANKLKNSLPHYCRVSNPLDILEEANAERIKSAVKTCLEDPSLKNLLIIFTTLGGTDPISMANIAVPLFLSKKEKTILVTLIGEDEKSQEARRILNKNGIPAFKSPEEAVQTFFYMFDYTKNLQLLYQTPEELPLNVEVPIHLKAILRKAFCEGRSFLNLDESLRFLEAYKLPIIKTAVAFNKEDAIRISSEIGYPVIMKSLHRSSNFREDPLAYEACSAFEVQKNFHTVYEETAIGTSEFAGIAIQPKISHDKYSYYIGSRKDGDFGAVIVFGAGRIEPYLYTKISFGFPPLNQVLAKQMIEGTKNYSLRNNIAQIQDGMIEDILKFSQLVTDFPEIMEADINPFVIEQNGCYALDARFKIDRGRIMREVAEHYDHMIIAPYPRKYVTKRTLKNGLQVKLRPIKPEDEICFHKLFKVLSEESVRFRFFEIIKDMPHEILTRYCNLDYDREIAIVAELESTKEIIGVVRLIIDNTGRGGEFAIMVGDSWHGLGLGSKLMDFIIGIAGDLNLEKIYSYVTSSNSKMINMCCKKGFEIEPVDDCTINMVKFIVP